MRKTAIYAVILATGALFSVIAASFLTWPGEMIAPFRPQLVVATLIPVIAALVLRAWKLAAASLAVFALNTAPMAIRLVDRPILAAPTHPNLGVLSTNVLFDNEDYDRVLTLVRREQPDVLVAAETGAAWVAHLDSLKDDYPYSFTLPEEGPFGLAIYAREPLTGSVVELGPRRLQLLRAEFADYVVYAVHPMPPATVSMTVDNKVYLEQLADIASAETKPVVLAGDFNTTLWSSNIAPLIKDRWQWPSGSGLAYTWPVGRPHMRIQIDHILTHGIKAGRFQVLEDIGSDHRPVRADLQF